MKLMSSAQAPSAFFPNRVGGSEAPGQPAPKRKGVCWQFNEAGLEMVPVSNMNVPAAGVVTHCHIVLNKGRDVPVILRKRGTTPVRVERMLPFLSSHPDRAAARLLESGFKEGFHIPCSLQRIPPCLGICIQRYNILR